MRLLTINSFDCSEQSSGGVNQTTVKLTNYLTSYCGVHCYLGFFENLPNKFAPLPLFEGRILLNRNFDEQAFSKFLLSNHIDIVQVNFLKKENLVVMPALYRVAKQCGVKVIYAFHMCPGFQIHTYGSFNRMLYGWQKRDNALAETKKWILTITQKLWLPIGRRLLQPKYKIPYESADKVVVLSKNYFAPYLYYAGIQQSEKMVAIGNSLRFSQYIRQDEIPLKDKTIIVVARFDEDTKRISYVLRTWREIERNMKYTDWKLQLVGDGRDMSFYRHLVKKWDLRRVEFTGHQNPESYYRRASLFLMTSTAEGWPMVLLEAQQMGIPVVAMDSFGALHDMIKDGYNGLIVPNNDLNAFCTAITNIMEDDSLRYKMSIHARESCKRFEIQHVIAQWKNIFEQLTSV